MEHPKITEARKKYHKVIVKRYGKFMLPEVLNMVQAGSTDYDKEVYKAQNEFYVVFTKVKQEIKNGS